MSLLVGRGLSAPRGQESGSAALLRGRLCPESVLESAWGGEARSLGLGGGWSRVILLGRDFLGLVTAESASWGP